MNANEINLTTKTKSLIVIVITAVSYLLGNGFPVVGATQKLSTRVADNEKTLAVQVEINKHINKSIDDLRIDIKEGFRELRKDIKSISK